jgi:Ni/Fe-hydrogenase subunit HybB-like protein
VPVVAARGVKPASGSVLVDLDDAIPGPRAVVWIICIGLVAIVILIVTALTRRPA